MRMPVEEMSERELLMELVTEKRREETLRWIRYGLILLVILVITVLAVKYLPPIFAFARASKATADEISEALKQINSYADKFADLDFSKLESLDFSKLDDFAAMFEKVLPTLEMLSNLFH